MCPIGIELVSFREVKYKGLGFALATRYYTRTHDVYAFTEE